VPRRINIVSSHDLGCSNSESHDSQSSSIGNQPIPNAEPLDNSQASNTSVPPTSVPPTSVPEYQIASISVSAKQGWQSTDIILRQGQRFQIEYQSGQWAGRVGYGPDLPDIWTDAEGTSQEIFYPEIGLTARFGSLIGKINDGPTLLLGKFYDFNSDTSGILFLRMHDSDGGLNDNEGSLQINIKVWP